MTLPFVRTAQNLPWVVQSDLWIGNPKEEEELCQTVLLPWAGHRLVAAEIGSLSQQFAGPDSFVLLQQADAAGPVEVAGFRCGCL